MTLREHAKKIFRERADSSGNFIAAEYQGPWLEAAYDELRVERDRLTQELAQARSALMRIYAEFNNGYCLGFDVNTTADRAVKVIKEWREKRPEQPKKACPMCSGQGQYDHPTWSGKPRRGVCGLCQGSGTVFGPAPEEQPPKKAVYEWQPPAYSGPHLLRTTLLLRNGIIAGRIIERPDGFYKWTVGIASSALDGEKASFPLAKAAVEAVVRAHYGDAV